MLACSPSPTKRRPDEKVELVQVRKQTSREIYLGLGGRQKDFSSFAKAKMAHNGGGDWARGRAGQIISG